MSEERRLRAILDAVPGSFLTLDQGMRINWMNQATSRWLPMMEIGSSIRESLAPIVNSEKLDRLLLLREKIAFRTTPDEPELQALLAAETLYDGSTLMMFWETSMAEDMTDRRTTFVMGSAHELRSPLTALVGFAEILDMESGRLSPAQAEAISMIHQNAIHLRTLVENILDLTQNSFGELRLHVSPVDLPAMAAEVIESTGPAAEEQGQTLKLVPATDPATVEADPGRVRQIMVNLIDNAVTHTPPGSEITVTAGRRGEWGELTVTDDGPGLPFEDPEEAFEPFRRGPDRADESGTGIGLAMVRRLVELHRGTVTVESSADGTTFTVRLPVQRVEQPEPGPIGVV